MVLRLFRGADEPGLDHIEAQLQQMLADDRHSFDMAMAALLGGADPDVVGPDVRATDQRVNEAEQAVRRELVVHSSVHGSGVDVGLVLGYMSIVKDIERIGDYAKNLFDLAEEGVDLSDDDDREDFVALRDQISEMIGRAAAACNNRDAEIARELIAEADGLRQLHNQAVADLVQSDTPSHHGVPRVLIHRYLKRVTAHLSNVMSSLTQPVDRLDYSDED